MTEAQLTIPAELRKWFLGQVREMARADLHESGSPSEITQSAVDEHRRESEAYASLLGQLEADADPEIDREFAAYLVRDVLGGVDEWMKVAIGGYDSDPLDCDKVREVGVQAVWLADSLEALEAEAVTV